MNKVKTSIGRRSFIKRSTIAGGGIMLSFNWLASCDMTPNQVKALPKEWFKINGFLKIGENGLITIMSPNPEIGQNIKTSMPMIVAEELDANWDDVIVEQAPLNTSIFNRQIAGGSQSIRQGWNSLRMAGATARAMLVEAAAQNWGVNQNEIITSKGQLIHKATGNISGFGPMASLASEMKVPKEVSLKEISDFKIIGTSRKNVDGVKIIGNTNLPGELPVHSSQVYASNIYNLIEEFWDEETKELTLDEKDEILSICLVSHKKEYINPTIKEIMQ